MANVQDVASEGFTKLCRVYAQRFGVRPVLCDAPGRVVRGKLPRAVARLAGSVELCRDVIAESLRWGEPSPRLCPPHHVLWAVPVTLNDQLLGGLVACVDEEHAFGADGKPPACDLRAAMSQLLNLAQWHHMTNSALMAAHRDLHQRERLRAEAIHLAKQDQPFSFRRVYAVEEPALIAAIRRGRRAEARDILNRVLVGMIHRAADRLDLAKSYFLELVVSMSRAAVEAGGSPEELFGSQYSHVVELSKITTDEEAAHWLHRMLEQVMDAIHERRTSSDAVLLDHAVRHALAHHDEDLSRDEVAEMAALSPSHFSRLVKRTYGKTFTELLNRVRIDHAADLLLRTDQPLKAITLACGFVDQSYFTKVFRRYTGMTPQAYRAQRQGAR